MSAVVVITVHWHVGYLDATVVAMMVMVYGDSDGGDSGFDDADDHGDNCDSDGARSPLRPVPSSPVLSIAPDSRLSPLALLFSLTASFTLSLLDSHSLPP